MKQLQSLSGSLTFFTCALPDGHAFSRRLYLDAAEAKRPRHLTKATKEMHEDLLMLK